MALRLIDAGRVPWLRSQALYHGLAHARTAATPDTVVLATPAEPYVCIGLHQDPAHELDLEACRRLRLPVLRRQTGGGAVYLDDRQLFVQWIMAPARLPARVDARFAAFCAPLVATWRAFGVAAEFVAPNDVHARGRKISGTGAARIGEAEVLTGNFLFDFPAAVMAEVVRAPSAAYRELVRESLDRYLTSLRRELPDPPPPAAVAREYARRCALAFGDELAPGALTAGEQQAVARLERELADPAFLAQPGGLRRPGLKIHACVQVVEQEVELPAGRVRLTARLRHGRIDALALAAADGRGRAPAGLEAALTGVALAPEPLRQALRRWRGEPPLDVAAWTQALLALERPPAG